MKTKKPTLDHFNGSSLNPSQMKHVRGAGTTVPPQGDPGDIKDPRLTNPRLNPPPPTEGIVYLDPNPEPIDTEYRP
ncbi:MAG TPA: hypothetical protein VJL37_06175 [Flavobacterium sp.]|nr:hypothetical protein [Flavobacterium sp.]